MAESEGRSEAESAFLAMLGTAGRLDEAGLEALCAQRPELDGELRELYASWRDLEPLLGSVLDGEGADRRLTALLDAGPSLQPTVPLDPQAGGGSNEAARLLAELAAAAGAGAEGRYENRGEAGRGGMAAVLRVWDARLRRLLAMKVLEPQPAPGVAPGAASAADSADVSATGSPGSPGWDAAERFLDEALVTGQLDHPGIVPVHDLGVDAQGRVFFTMKLVKGRDLRRVLRLVVDGLDGWTLNRAVGVLRRVCEAVAYAHSKGVIHRDIKPANIMVGRYGETYLMDWGLARVLGGEPLSQEQPAVQPLIEEEPEAARGSGDDPDSWLFTQDGRVLGTPVYMSPEQARGDVAVVDERTDIYSLGAILYHLLSGRMPYVEPDEMVLPFTVLMCVRRGPPAPLGELCPEAPPTLLAICQKAMAREPAERFASADEMAAALADYLEDISEAREEARRQARRAQRINEFLVQMLASGDPAMAQGRDVTVREVLDGAAMRVATAFPDQPLDEADLRETIGNLYRELGRPDEAETHLSLAVDLRADSLGHEHAETLSATTELALLRRRQGRMDEAEALLRATLEQQQRSLGEDHVDTLRTLDVLASVLRRAGTRLDEAEALYRRAVEGLERVRGEQHPVTLATAGGLAQLLRDRGRVDEAIDLQQCVAEQLDAHHGPRHPNTLIATNNLASMLQASGRLDEAEPLYRRTLEGQRAVLGARHPETLACMNNLAWLQHRRGCTEEAQALLEEAVREQRGLLGEGHPHTLSFVNNLALLMVEQGRAAEAEPLLRECVMRSEAALPEGHHHTERYRSNLGRCLARLDRLEEARTALDRAGAALASALGAEHAWVREAEQERSDLDEPA